VRSLLVIFSLLGLYSQIPLSLGGVQVPNVLGLISGAALLGINAKQVEVEHVKRICSILVIAFFSIILAPQFNEFFSSRLLALVQMTISMISGYGLFLELRKAHTERAAKLFISFCIIIIVGSLLEVVSPLRGIITAFTVYIWDYDFLNQSIRDLNIAGFVRPTFFTSEPSHVAKGIVIFAIALLILNPTAKAAFWTGAILVIGIAITRSPSVAVGIPMIFIVYWYAHRKYLGGLERGKRARQAIALLILIGTPMAAGSLILLTERIDQVVSGTDYSVSLRLLASTRIGLEAALRYPIGGVGLGGYQAVEALIIGIAIESGVPYYEAHLYWPLLINNGIGAHFLYFGFVLLAFYVFSFYRLLDSLSTGNGAMLFFIVVCLCFFEGSIYSPRFVIYYFLFAAASQISLRSVVLASHNARKWPD
jgi:hypothetical protein